MRTQQQINNIVMNRRSILFGCSENVFDEILGELDYHFSIDDEVEWDRFLTAASNVQRYGCASQ